MNIQGLIVGLVSFMLIGIFHVIVLKCEYYFSKKIWPIFFMAGFVSLIGSLYMENAVLSSVSAVFGFTCLWSIRELFEQEERVRKGWYPRNPKHEQRYIHQKPMKSSLAKAVSIPRKGCFQQPFPNKPETKE